jgi:hypothetical protein
MLERYPFRTVPVLVRNPDGISPNQPQRHVGRREFPSGAALHPNPQHQF